jgi:cytochrome c-type protein NapB
VFLTKIAPAFSRELVWIGLIASGCGVVGAASLGLGQPGEAPPMVAGVPMPMSSTRNGPVEANDRAAMNLAWRLNNPAPNLVPEARANPAAVPDKLAARVRTMEQRASLRAYEGAPPVIPHAIAHLNVQTCRACHAQGLRAGDKVARMASHTYMPNCTQCHVEAAAPMLGNDGGPANSFVGLRSSGYGGTRAWAGAPPVMPHTTFMRTNCVSCHGEHGYDGWRPDHLSRTNCVQCHAPAAEFDQLAPSFAVPDVPEGR